MRNRTLLAASALVVGLLTACGSDNPPASSGGSGSGGAGAGSGGAGAGGGGVAPGNNVTLNGGSLSPAQKTAEDLIAAANGGVATLNKADAATRATGLGGVASTTECATLGGSGSITFDTTITGTSLAGSTQTTIYNACALYGYVFNGTIVQTYENFVNETDFTVNQTYTNFSISGNGLATEAVSGSERCVVKGNTESCAQYLNGYRVSGVEVSNSGSTTTVRAGELGGSTPYGNANCVYNGWTFNNTTGRANAGTVAFDYGNGNTAVVTATSTGYTVRITLNGTTTNYTVAFS